MRLHRNSFRVVEEPPAPPRFPGALALRIAAGDYVDADAEPSRPVAPFDIARAFLLHCVCCFILFPWRLSEAVRCSSARPRVRSSGEVRFLVDARQRPRDVFE